MATSGQYAEANWTVPLYGDGNYSWNCRANNSTTESVFAESNRTVIVNSTASVTLVEIISNGEMTMTNQGSIMDSYWCAFGAKQCNDTGSSTVYQIVELNITNTGAWEFDKMCATLNITQMTEGNASWFPVQPTCREGSFKPGDTMYMYFYIQNETEVDNNDHPSGYVTASVTGYYKGTPVTDTDTLYFYYKNQNTPTACGNGNFQYQNSWAYDTNGNYLAPGGPHEPICIEAYVGDIVTACVNLTSVGLSKGGLYDFQSWVTMPVPDDTMQIINPVFSNFTFYRANDSAVLGNYINKVYFNYTDVMEGLGSGEWYLVECWSVELKKEGDVSPGVGMYSRSTPTETIKYDYVHGPGLIEIHSFNTPPSGININKSPDYQVGEQGGIVEWDITISNPGDSILIDDMENVSDWNYSNADISTSSDSKEGDYSLEWNYTFSSSDDESSSIEKNGTYDMTYSDSIFFWFWSNDTRNILTVRFGSDESHYYESSIWLSNYFSESGNWANITLYFDSMTKVGNWVNKTAIKWINFTIDDQPDTQMGTWTAKIDDLKFMGHGIAYNVTLVEYLDQTFTYKNMTYRDNGTLLNYDDYNSTTNAYSYYSFGNLGFGETIDLTLAAQADYDCGYLTNVTKNFTKYDNVTVFIPCVYNLTLNKSVNKTWYEPGDVAYYSIMMVNTGYQTIHNLTLTDTMPENVSYRSDWSNGTNSTSGGTVTFSQSGRNLYWNMSNLSNGAYWQVNFSVYIHSNASYMLNNSANVIAYAAKYNHREMGRGLSGVCNLPAGRGG
ncbi:MAG: hypothetical protein A7315_14685 [Candidatus Altiarchaeales archaeon WOR_SM1_79]|nr:MAG: hypothetical protein A7315_14685 [Candidatus Altiarchaeales archaeon WOR_SM1_79]